MLYNTGFHSSKINKRHSAIYISKFDWKFMGKQERVFISQVKLKDKFLDVLFID